MYLPRTRHRTTHLLDDAATIHDIIFDEITSEEIDRTLIDSQPVLARPQNFSESYIRDRKASGKWRYHDCYHQRLRADYGVINTTTMSRTPWLKYRLPGRFDREISVPCGTIFKDLYTQHGDGFGVIFPLKRVDHWFADMSLPSRIVIDRDPFDSDFSIWFLVADVKQLPKLVSQIFSRQIIRRSDLAGTRTFKQLADDDLLAKFGVAATFNDMVDFVGVLKRFMRGFDEFVKADKIYRWHSAAFNVTEAVPTVPPALFTWDSHGLGDRLIYRQTTIQSCHHYRTMAYRIVAPELHSWLSRIRQFIDLFGVLDPAALWDRLPFSFIVDWFYGVGKMLHANKPRLFVGAVKVEDFCESMKVVYNNEYYASDPSSFGGPDNPSIGVEQHSTYIRHRYQPEVGDIVQGTGHPLLSVRQAIIAAGLTAQRLPRPGNIGDLFEGIDFGQDPMPVNSVAAAQANQVNKAWADLMRHRKASLNGGVYPALRKFEMKLGERRQADKRDAEMLSRLPRWSKRAGVQFIPMRERTWSDLRNSVRVSGR